jgi:Uma2 family endonuclease
MTAIPFRQEVYYPESDGKPMGETEVHIREIMYVCQALDEHLRHVPDVYVGADLLLYYVEGNPKMFVVPDVFVTLGVPRGERRTYKLWQEGRPPSVVVEVTSDSTSNEDVVKKKALYERLGVEEYVLHDPLGDYLSPPLQAFRLVMGRYQAVPLDSAGSFQSRTLGVTFRMEGRGVRLLDTTTGELILSNEEVREELARLRAENARLRGQG